MTEALAGDPPSDLVDLAAAAAAVRARIGVVAILLAGAGLAWWSTADRMAAMSASPGADLGALGWFTGVWVVMMAAMMLPSLSPTAAVYATLAGRREPSRWVLFVAGYLLVWSAAGVVAYGLFELGKTLLSSELAWRGGGGRLLAAGVLGVAALYQLTPPKDACLRRCRTPLRSMRARWRDSRSGALAMGVRNGCWCLGCSWALMAALFALGVMSLTWMALVAALVGLEKVGPSRRAATVATAAVLGALAVAILATPHNLPGLVIPGQPGAMHAMSGMG
jgi:predicted metal-binding membrane protein